MNTQHAVMCKGGRRILLHFRRVCANAKRPQLLPKNLPAKIEESLNGKHLCSQRAPALRRVWYTFDATFFFSCFCLSSSTFFQVSGSDLGRQLEITITRPTTRNRYARGLYRVSPWTFSSLPLRSENTQFRIFHGIIITASQGQALARSDYRR